MNFTPIKAQQMTNTRGRPNHPLLPGLGRVKQTYYYNGIFSAEAIESEEMTPCRGDEKKLLDVKNF